jgi:flagellar basal-body rod protein FlgB
MPVNRVNDFLWRRMDANIPLKKGLDAFALRQKTLASNVANAETPGYAARRVEFENELQKILDRQSSGVARTHREHIPVRAGLRRMERLQPEVVKNDTLPFINGVNNVDIDMEMAEMATNQIHFATASKVMGIRFKMLTSAIQGH